eukprot:COSAG02_NODE_4627_length_5151_cov_2.807601_5_plen_418_part_00
MAAQQNEQGESHVERAASPFRPYDEAGGQRCAVGFVGHVEIGPPRVPKADSFVQYTFTVRTEVSGTLEFTDRFSTMHMRHQQLKQQGVLEHYAPPLVFPSKGAVMPWWPGADKRIVERGEQLADYYQRLVCEATLETLEALGTCWAPGYTLHELAPSRDAAEPEGSHEVSAVASHLEEGGSTGVAQGSAERQGQVDAADIDALPPAPEDLPQTNAAAWWTVLLVLLVAIVIGGAATLGPTIIGTTTDKHALPIGRVPSRGQLDDMRTNLRAAEASRVDPTRADEIDAAAAAAAAAAEVERAQQLKARLEMRRAKLTAAEEDQRTLQEAERKRKKQRAAYEASVVRRHDTGQPHTRLQQDLGPYSVETKTSSLQTILTKHGCTCLPTTIDRADPSAPVEWDGCASRTSDSFACICGSL